MTQEELESLGVSVSPEAYARLAAFIERLLIENQSLNLTRVRDEADAWMLHVCESLTLLPLIDDLAATRVLDLGTGGGVPGLPLACARPDLHVALLDSTRKKLDAAQRIADAVGLTNISIHWGRAEALAHEKELRETFDAIVARAVGKLPILCEYAAGFVRVGGRCWFMKTPAALEEEIPAATSAARACSLKFTQAVGYALGEHGDRAIAIYEKFKPLRPTLPRTSGRAAKAPL